MYFQTYKHNNELIFFPPTKHIQNITYYYYYSFIIISHNLFLTANVGIPTEAN